MSKSSTFKVQINGGPVQEITTKTGQYALAAMAALANLDYEANANYDVVKIWVEKLLPEYGPYFYAFDGHSLGIPSPERKF